MVFVKIKKLAEGLENKTFEISEEKYNAMKEYYDIVEEPKKTEAKKTKASKSKKSK